MGDRTKYLTAIGEPTMTGQTADGSPPALSHEEQYLELLKNRDKEIRHLLEENQMLADENLRLKEQLKNAGESNAEKDAIIRALQQQLNDFHVSGRENDTLKRNEKSRQYPWQSDGYHEIAITADSQKPDESDKIRIERLRLKKAPKPIDKNVINKYKEHRRYYSSVSEQTIPYWKELIAYGFVDEQLRFKKMYGNDVAALIVNRFQTVVDSSITWAFFNRHWKISNLQAALRHPTYKGERHYATVNRIFKLPDDAPVFSKSSME